MKLTLNNLKALKRQSTCALKKRVLNYTISRWGDYDDKTYIFRDVLEHGCQSGIVGELIYYSDTVAFYKRYRTESNKLLSAYMSETGLYNLSELFDKRWDTDDPLAT